MSAGMKGLEERSTSDNLVEDEIAETLAKAFKANIYDHPHKAVSSSDENTIRLFADHAAEILAPRIQFDADRIATLEAEVDGLLAVVADRDRRLKLWKPTTVCQTVSSSYREAVRAFNTTKESDIDRAALAAGEG